MIFTLGKGRKTILQLYLAFPVCASVWNLAIHHNRVCRWNRGVLGRVQKHEIPTDFVIMTISPSLCSSSSSKSGFKKSEGENAVGTVGDWAKAPKSILSQAVERSSHYRWLLSLSSTSSSSLSLSSSTSSSSSNRPASSYSIYSPTLAPSFGLSVIISQLYWQQGRICWSSCHGAFKSH